MVIIKNRPSSKCSWREMITNGVYFTKTFNSQIKQREIWIPRSIEAYGANEMNMVCFEQCIETCQLTRRLFVVCLQIIHRKETSCFLYQCYKYSSVVFLTHLVHFDYHWMELKNRVEIVQKPPDSWERNNQWIRFIFAGKC